MENVRKTVLTCAQPTGKLHLGNYLGAIREWKRYLEGHDCYFGIVNMHAITMPYKPSELRQSTLDCAAQYIACGLDPKKCNIFVQSQAPFHAELMWVLSCICPLGQLERMTQYKDKSKRQGESVNAGLLYYPILQAADILLYNADIVPVGEDQKQHLELTRDLAQKFNAQYSDTFTIPEVHIPKKGARIMALQDPTAKMSKSDPNQNSVLYLWDEPEVIRKKIGSAVTDSGSSIQASPEKAGITNLLNILHVITNKPMPALEAEFQGASYQTFKSAVAEALIGELEPLQKQYALIKEDKAALLGILAQGAEAARRRTYRVYEKVYRKVGFLQKD